MKDLQIFNHPMFGELPVVMIDGKEHFGANEVAGTLEYTRPYKAVSDHCDSDGVLTWDVIDRLERNQQKKFITLGNISRLIVAASKQSKNPEIQRKAKQYEKWIFDDVIPSIHKHGAYATPQTLDNMIDNPEFGIKVLTALQKERNEKKALQIETAEKDKLIGELKPKAAYTDIILKNKGLVTITQIAKDYGMTAQEMNDLLRSLQVQYKQSKQWLLYKKYADKGYVHSNTIPITRSDGTPDISMSTKWTQKGRLFIYELLKSNDALPVIERDSETKRSGIDG